MPTNLPEHIGLICDYVRVHQPTSILDVGIGNGKWGVLFREYTENWNGGAFHKPESWKTKIYGVEIFPEYITPVSKYVYNEIFLGDIIDLLAHNKLPKVELVTMFDVIEHFEMGIGKSLIVELKKICNRMIISTPNFQTNFKKPMRYGNPYEAHKCRWFVKDFGLTREWQFFEGRLLTAIWEKPNEHA